MTDEQNREFDAAISEAATSSKTHSVTLSDGKIVTFDWGKLTGRQLLNISEELQGRTGAVVISRAFNERFQILLAARSNDAGLGYEQILDLPAEDYIQIVDAAKGFLLQTGLTSRTAATGSASNT